MWERSKAPLVEPLRLKGGKAAGVRSPRRSVVPIASSQARRDRESLLITRSGLRIRKHAVVDAACLFFDSAKELGRAAGRIVGNRRPPAAAFASRSNSYRQTGERGC